LPEASPGAAVGRSPRPVHCRAPCGRCVPQRRFCHWTRLRDQPERVKQHFGI